jgi:hypothetical protein
MKTGRTIAVRTALVCALVLSFALISKGQQSAAVQARVTQPVDLRNVVTLRGNTHPLARPKFDQGVAPDGLPTERMLLVLKRSADQETALRKLLDDQQTKPSASYHMWLTPEQFGQQFGPADADIQAVTDWLTSQGFQVSHVAAGRTVIEFSGTAGTVRRALHTEIHKYVVNGEEHWANATDPQIPAALAPVVAGFASLNNFPRKPMIHRLGTFLKEKATGVVKPLFTYPYMSGYLLGVGPGDFATIYNLSPLYSASTNGSGQSIAVVAETNINLQDVSDFRTMFHVLPLNNLPTVILNGPDPGILSETGDESESDLDVEWAGAVAPSATIDLVVSESTEVTAGVDLSALYVIDNNLAPIMSESYGGCEAALGAGGNAFYSTVWEQGAAEGITIIEAAGDDGSAGCDVYGPSQGDTAAEFGLAVSGNASTPFNVAVGGTDFNDSSSISTYWSQTNNSTTQSSAKSYIPEMTWNDSCASTGSLSACTTVSAEGTDVVGGGGGESNCTNYIGTFTPLGYECTAGYTKPVWQTGTGVPADGARDVPDVSMFAGDGFVSGSFYVFCQTDANDVSAGASATSCDLNSPYLDFQGAGGTSASTQVFGGIMALVNQKYGRQGVANYVLYPLAASSGASCASNSAAVTTTSCIFYDTQTGNNSVACVLDYPNCSSSSTISQYGILVSPISLTPQAAWTTTPGYDLATGLGTVNAANLVSKWNSVSFTPTTTALTLTPPTGYTLSTIPHGQPVGVSVSVSPAASTGDVALLGGPAGYNATCASTPCNLGIDFATLSSGSVSGSTTLLPGGTYNVTARYAGDGTHAASTSSPVAVTVAPENSDTILQLATEDCNENVTYVTTGSFPYGNSISCSTGHIPQYWLRMDVTNSSGNLCFSSTTGNTTYQCPTGQVTVTLNGGTMPASTDVGAPTDNTPGTYTLNSQGTAEDQFLQLPVGTDALVATYNPHPIPPNNSYNTSTSTADSVTITQAATTTAVSAPSTTTSGASVTLTASVNTGSLGLAPAGTVTFYNGNLQISGTPTYTYVAGSFAGLASLTATLSTSFTANASITAKYSGNVNYAASTSPAVTITISTTQDFSLSASPANFTITSPGQSGGTTVSASSIAGFSGTVTITCALPSSMTYSTCTLSTNTLTPGGAGSLLTVATTAPSIALRPVNRPRWFMPSAGALLACIMLLLISRKNRRHKLAFGLLVFALLAAAFVACGGGSSTTGPSSPGTPTGSYTVTVTGTSGQLSHPLNIPVTVQ